MAEELILKIQNAGDKATKNGNGETDKQPKGFVKNMQGAVQGGLKKAGVSFTVGALLKQSQLFTSFMGSIFQIVGGMIDLMLAPLMPIFIPVLKFLAKMMPGVRITATAIANKLIEIGTTIATWWKDHAPSWLQGGDGTKIAQVLGGVVTALMFTKFTGIWKLGKWFLGMRVGQKAGEAAVKGAAKGATKTIGSVIKSWFGQQIGKFRSWLWGRITKIPGVQKIVDFASDGLKLFSSWRKELIKNIRSSIGNAAQSVRKWIAKAVTNVASHIFKGNWKAVQWMATKLLAPFKWASNKIKDFLRPAMKHVSELWDKITKWISKGPIGTALKALGNRLISFVRGIWSPIAKKITSLWGTVTKFLNRGPLKTLFGFIGKIWQKFLGFLNIFKGSPGQILQKIAEMIKSVLTKPFDIIAKIADKFPSIGKAVSGLKNIFTKGPIAKALGGGAGGMLAKVGGKTGLKAAAMSIPGVSAAIGLGIGVYESQRMVREYGFNAKTVGAGLAYTSVQTAAGFAGGGIGIAAAIAGEVALNQFENRVLKVEVTGPDAQTKISAQTQDGKDQAMQQTAQASDYAYTG
tara:strand:+ start:649 stop:2376 length:1728 start_codon:yes stop_codon:yes gene_type:complete